MALVLLLLALGPPGTGCATKRDIRDLRDELRLRALRQDSALAEIRRLARAALDSIRGERGELLRFRGDVVQQLLAMEEQLVQIQELTGQSQRRLAELRDQLEARALAVRGAGAQDTAPPPAGVPPASDAEAVYSAALLQLQRGSVVTAREGFREFLRLFADHALAPEAQYWLGMTYEQENRHDEAIREYLALQELYPAAERVPAALYRVALIELGRDRIREARRYLERIVSGYPESDAAELAREQLREIRR